MTTGGGEMMTTTMARGGRGYPAVVAVVAVVAVLSAVAVCHRNDVGGFWRGAGGVGRDVVVVTAVKLQE